MTIVLMMDNIKYLKVHTNYSDSESSSGGKSDFDEEYERFKPPEKDVENCQTVTIAAEPSCSITNALSYSSAVKSGLNEASAPKEVKSEQKVVTYDNILNNLSAKIKSKTKKQKKGANASKTETSKKEISSKSESTSEAKVSKSDKKAQVSVKSSASVENFQSSFMFPKFGEVIPKNKIKETYVNSNPGGDMSLSYEYQMSKITINDAIRHKVIRICNHGLACPLRIIHPFCLEVSERVPPTNAAKYLDIRIIILKYNDYIQKKYKSKKPQIYDTKFYENFLLCEPYDLELGKAPPPRWRPVYQVFDELIRRGDVSKKDELQKVLEGFNVMVEGVVYPLELFMKESPNRKVLEGYRLRRNAVFWSELVCGRNEVCYVYESGKLLDGCDLKNRDVKLKSILGVLLVVSNVLVKPTEVHSQVHFGNRILKVNCNHEYFISKISIDDAINSGLVYKKTIHQADIDFLMINIRAQTIIDELYKRIYFPSTFLQSFPNMNVFICLQNPLCKDVPVWKNLFEAFMDLKSLLSVMSYENILIHCVEKSYVMFNGITLPFFVLKNHSFTEALKCFPHLKLTCEIVFSDSSICNTNEMCYMFDYRRNKFCSKFYSLVEYMNTPLHTYLENPTSSWLRNDCNNKVFEETWEHLLTSTMYNFTRLFDSDQQKRKLIYFNYIPGSKKVDKFLVHAFNTSLINLDDAFNHGIVKDVFERKSADGIFSKCVSSIKREVLPSNVRDILNDYDQSQIVLELDWYTNKRGIPGTRNAFGHALANRQVLFSFNEKRPNLDIVVPKWKGIYEIFDIVRSRLVAPTYNLDRYVKEFMFTLNVMVCGYIIPFNMLDQLKGVQVILPKPECEIVLQDLVVCAEYELCYFYDFYSISDSCGFFASFTSCLNTEDHRYLATDLYKEYFPLSTNPMGVNATVPPTQNSVFFCGVNYGMIPAIPPGIGVASKPSNTINFGNVQVANLNNPQVSNFDIINFTNLHSMDGINLNSSSVTNLHSLQVPNLNSANFANLNSAQITNFNSANFANLNNVQVTNLKSDNVSSINSVKVSNLGSLDATNLHSVNTNLNSAKSINLNNANAANLNSRASVSVTEIPPQSKPLPKKFKSQFSSLDTHMKLLEAVFKSDVAKLLEVHHRREIKEKLQQYVNTFQHWCKNYLELEQRPTPTSPTKQNRSPTKQSKSDLSLWRSSNLTTKVPVTKVKRDLKAIENLLDSLEAFFQLESLPAEDIRTLQEDALQKPMEIITKLDLVSKFKSFSELIGNACVQPQLYQGEIAGQIETINNCLNQLKKIFEDVEQPSCCFELITNVRLLLCVWKCKRLSEMAFDEIIAPFDELRDNLQQDTSFEYLAHKMHHYDPLLSLSPSNWNQLGTIPDSVITNKEPIGSSQTSLHIHVEQLNQIVEQKKGTEESDSFVNILCDSDDDNVELQSVIWEESGSILTQIDPIPEKITPITRKIAPVTNKTSLELEHFQNETLMTPSSIKQNEPNSSLSDFSCSTTEVPVKKVNKKIKMIENLLGVLETFFELESLSPEDIRNIQQHAVKKPMEVITELDHLVSKLRSSCKLVDGSAFPRGIRPQLYQGEIAGQIVAIHNRLSGLKKVFDGVGCPSSSFEVITNVRLLLCIWKCSRLSEIVFDKAVKAQTAIFDQAGTNIYEARLSAFATAQTITFERLKTNLELDSSFDYLAHKTHQYDALLSMSSSEWDQSSAIFDSVVLHEEPTQEDADSREKCLQIRVRQLNRIVDEFSYDKVFLDFGQLKANLDLDSSFNYLEYKTSHCDQLLSLSLPNWNQLGRVSVVFPVAKEVRPAISEISVDTKEVLPVTNKDLSVISEIPPVTNEVIPITNEVLSNAKILPVTKEVLPLTDEVLSATSEVLSITTDVLPITNEFLPITNEPLNTTKQNSVTNETALITQKTPCIVPLMTIENFVIEKKLGPISVEFSNASNLEDPLVILGAIPLNERPPRINKYPCQSVANFVIPRETPEPASTAKGASTLQDLLTKFVPSSPEVATNSPTLLEISMKMAYDLCTSLSTEIPIPMIPKRVFSTKEENPFILNEIPPFELQEVPSVLDKASPGSGKTTPLLEEASPPSLLEATSLSDAAYLLEAASLLEAAYLSEASSILEAASILDASSPLKAATFRVEESAPLLKKTVWVSEDTAPSLEAATYSLEEATYSLEEATYSLEEATYSLEEAKSALEETDSVLQVACLLEEAAFPLQGPAFISEQASSVLDEPQHLLEPASLLEAAFTSKESAFTAEKVPSLDEVVVSLEKTVSPLDGATFSLEEAASVLEETASLLEKAASSMEATRGKIMPVSRGISEEPALLAKEAASLSKEAASFAKDVASTLKEGSFSLRSKDVVLIAKEFASVSKRIASVSKEIVLELKETSSLSKEASIFPKGFTPILIEAAAVLNQAVVISKEAASRAKDAALVTKETVPFSEEVTLVSKEVVFVPKGSVSVPEESVSVSNKVEILSEEAVSEETGFVSERVSSVLKEVTSVAEKASVLSKTSLIPKETELASKETTLVQQSASVSEDSSLSTEVDLFTKETRLVLKEAESHFVSERVLSVSENAAFVSERASTSNEVAFFTKETASVSKETTLKEIASVLEESAYISKEVVSVAEDPACVSVVASASKETASVSGKSALVSKEAALVTKEPEELASGSKEVVFASKETTESSKEITYDLERVASILKEGVSVSTEAASASEKAASISKEATLVTMEEALETASVSNKVASISKQIALASEEVAFFLEEAASVLEKFVLVPEEAAPVSKEATLNTTKDALATTEAGSVPEVATVSTEAFPILIETAFQEENVLGQVLPVLEVLPILRKSLRESRLKKSCTFLENVPQILRKSSSILKHVSPISRKVSPLSQKVSPISRKVPPFSRKVQPISRKVQPISPKVQPILRKASPISKKVPKSVSLKRTPISLKQLSSCLNNHGCHFSKPDKMEIVQSCTDIQDARCGVLACDPKRICKIVSERREFLNSQLEATDYLRAHIDSVKISLSFYISLWLLIFLFWSPLVVKLLLIIVFISDHM